MFRLATRASRICYRFSTKQQTLYGLNHYKIKPAFNVSSLSFARLCSTSAKLEPEETIHSIITENERARGPQTKLGFQAETKKLLDIVARSLYSDKEVFIRELISNASDANERLRFKLTTGEISSKKEKPLEIHIKTEENKKLLIIQDTGIGMTREEMQKNLGTIAHSGSKEFVSKLSDSEGASTSNDIIGQFGVGFYASFMVADKVDVFSLSQAEDPSKAVGHHWSSSGIDGEFELGEAENVSPGTKIVLQLKENCAEFSKEEVVERILRKYSNFVGTPIFLNGRRINVIEPLWLKDASAVTPEEHMAFYQYLTSNTYDSPRYTFMYKTDAPLSLRVVLYVPNFKPSIFDVARENDNGIALYSRKVMIMSRTEAILPKWLRFLKGVVDSEDIPLNLSRELLQDNSLIRRINRLLTARVIRFLGQQASKDMQKFTTFLNDFGLYLKEGIVVEGEQEVREEIAKLLRWESSALPEGQTTNFEEYTNRMRAGSRNIYFLSAPNRTLAESSPYLEAVRKNFPDTEVLFLYEPYDELVFMQLGQFDKKTLSSVETLIAEDQSDTDTVGPERPDSLTQDEASKLVQWAEKVLGPKVNKVKVTQRLIDHPCMVSIREAGAMRHFLRTTLADRPAEERFRVMQPILNLNVTHKLVRFIYDRINSTSNEDDPIAVELIEYLLDNAMAQAGLLDDVRSLTTRMTHLITNLIDQKK